jgi:hypothetical protein
MDLPDFDETFDPDFDPDLLDMKPWSEVPQPIRKIVEQHVAARLPAKVLPKLRATCTPAVSPSVLTRRSSILGAAWPCETFAENGSVTTSRQRAAAWAAIGTTATSVSSSRSPAAPTVSIRFRQRRVSSAGREDRVSLALGSGSV